MLEAKIVGGLLPSQTVRLKIRNIEHGKTPENPAKTGMLELNMFKLRPAPGINYRLEAANRLVMEKSLGNHLLTRESEGPMPA